MEQHLRLSLYVKVAVKFVAVPIFGPLRVILMSQESLLWTLNICQAVACNFIEVCRIDYTHTDVFSSYDRFQFRPGSCVNVSQAWLACSEVNIIKITGGVTFQCSFSFWVHFLTVPVLQESRFLKLLTYQYLGSLHPVLTCSDTEAALMLFLHLSQSSQLI